MRFPSLKRIWHFIWYEDSVWSWIVNIILAFVLIKFIVYPVLGLALGTGFPIVAVVSSSMEHPGGTDTWWQNYHYWYDEHGITQDEFQSFPLRYGFNKGDIMILVGRPPGKIMVGDVIVFKSGKPDPIIHRVVEIIPPQEEPGSYVFHTKGDNNPDSIRTSLIDETNIPEDHVLGVAVLRIPLLGYLKIGFVSLLQLFMTK